MIKVLLFAGLQEQAGLAQLEWAYEPMNVGELKTRIKAAYPQLRLDYAMAAVNEQFAPASLPIRDGDTVALLPPVSGG